MAGTAADGRTRGSALLRESRAGSLGSMVALVAGLALDLTLAVTLGAGADTDALFVALRIPLGIAVFFPPTAVQVLVPQITNWLHLPDRRSANANTTRVLAATLLISLGLAAAGALAAPVLVRAMAPGVEASALEVAAGLARVAFFMVPMAASAQILRAYRHASRRHGLASALQAVLGLTIIGTVLIVPGVVEVRHVVWAYLGGTTAELAFAWVLARAQGFRFAWGDADNPELRLLGSKALRPLAASSIQLLLRLGEQVVASFLAPGSITILNYAQRLINAVGGTLVFKPVVTAFLVPMSSLQRWGDRSGVRDLLRQALRSLLFVSLALTALVAVAGAAFVSGVFSLGDLTAEQAALLGLTVAVYSASLPTAATQRILLAVSFSRLETSPYLRNTVYGAVANAALLATLALTDIASPPILLVPIAYGFAQIINVWHAARVARSEVGEFQILDGIGRPMIAVAMAALAMMASATIFDATSNAGRVTEGLVTAVVGVSTLGVATRLLVTGGLRSFVPSEKPAVRRPDPAAS